MKKLKMVWKEVDAITQELIRCGLAEEYNFAVIRRSDVIWSNYHDISRYLKNMSYLSIYEEIEKERNYNVKLPDGGMIQLMYRFDSKGDSLLSHRLAYYPSPSYELYQNDARMYDEDDIYGDILNKSVLPVVIRADYNRELVESEIHHPYSHITLGEYKNCRIPADRPISPMEFVKSVIEHFYYLPSAKLQFDFALKSIVRFETHLAQQDQRKSHMRI